MEQFNAVEQVYWSPGVTLENIEKQVILKAFRFYRGNKTQCSISLGINVRTLERKLEEYEQAGAKQREQEQREERERAEILDRQRGIIPGTREEAGGPRIFGSNSGVHMEPTYKSAPESAVPLPERKEVQKVLPGQAGKSSSAGRR